MSPKLLGPLPLLCLYPFWEQPKVDCFYILLVLGGVGIKWLVNRLLLSCTLHIFSVQSILQFLAVQSSLWLWICISLQFSFGALVVITCVVPSSSWFWWLNLSEGLLLDILTKDSWYWWARLPSMLVKKGYGSIWKRLQRMTITFCVLQHSMKWLKLPRCAIGFGTHTCRGGAYRGWRAW